MRADHAMTPIVTQSSDLIGPVAEEIRRERAEEEDLLPGGGRRALHRGVAVHLRVPHVLALVHLDAVDAADRERQEHERRQQEGARSGRDPRHPRAGVTRQASSRASEAPAAHRMSIAST